MSKFSPQEFQIDKKNTVSGVESEEDKNKKGAASHP
jgi:hypothetical protein